MTLRKTIVVLFAGCTIFSHGANAFWFFQHRPAPVTRLSHSHHHSGFRHHRHYHAYVRHVRTYRRVITEYRIYYVPEPYPAAPPQHAKRPAPGLKKRLSPSVTVPGSPAALPAPMVAAPASRPPATLAAAPNSKASAAVAVAPAARPPASGQLPIAQAAQAPGSTLAPIAMQAGTAATSASAHRTAAASAYQAAPAGGAMAGTHAGRTVYGAARLQQVAAGATLAHTVPGAIAIPQHRSDGILHASQESSFLAFLAPLTAAAAALAGLGYTIFRKRKRNLPGAARQVEAVQPQPVPHNGLAAAGSPSPSPAATPHRGFNYDEVRRVNVDRVFIAPFPHATAGTGGAAAVEATNAGGNTEAAEQAPERSALPTDAKVVQHGYGDVTQGIVDEIYDTPEAKARLEGFYSHIPAEFQTLSWMKVTYDQGHIYTFAAAMPGMVIHPGDTVRLVFGQQNPPVPNRVVAVTHVRSAAPGMEAGIMDGSA